jgi:hypothetical protein
MTTPPGHGRIGPYQIAERDSGSHAAERAAAPDGLAVLVWRLHQAFARNPGTLQRLSATLQQFRRHPPAQVVPVVAADLAAAEPYVVTADVAGRTWSDWIAASRPRSGRDLERLAHDLAVAVHQVHGSGIPYGVLTASTVTVVDGQPRLDIGYLCAIGPDPVPDAEHFTAPEVRASAAADGAADVFSWAVLTVYAATGRAPLRPSASVNALPPKVRSLVQRALSADPSARPTFPQIITGLGGTADTSTAVSRLDWTSPGDSAQTKVTGKSTKVTRGEILLISVSAMVLALISALPVVGVVATAVMLAVWAGLAASVAPEGRGRGVSGAVAQTIFRFAVVAGIFLVLAMLIALVAPIQPPDLILPSYLAALIALFTGAQVSGAFHARHEFARRRPARVVGLTVTGSALVAITVLLAIGADPVWWPLDQEAQDAIVDTVSSCPSVIRFLCR